MKTLKAYIECGDAATPANTMGMGNPGETGPDTLSEPIGTAKSEVEKEKKKRKKKIKSLAESLFDDNITKEYVLGDLLDLEGWESADVTDTGDIQKVWYYNFDIDKLEKIVKKPRWKKLLKPFANKYEDTEKRQRAANVMYDWNLFYWYFTWIVMCSTSNRNAPQNLRGFMKEIESTESDYREDDLRLTEPVEIIVLNGLGNMKDFPRLIVLKLYTKHRDYVVYMKLKKKD